MINKKYTVKRALVSALSFTMLLVSCSEDRNTNSITVVKSERIQEKHPEIVIIKKDPLTIKPNVTKDSYKEITETHEKKTLTEVTSIPLSSLKSSAPNKQYNITKNQGEIAQNILSKLKENKNLHKRPIRIAYFNPSDRKPIANYQARIQKIITEIQSFYGKGMEQNGFGYRTFDLEMIDKKLQIHFIQSNKPKHKFARNSYTSNHIYSAVSQKLKKSGINIENETVIVFQNLARIESNSFFDTDAPYYGTWNTNINRKGFCYVVDSEYLDWKNLTEKKNRFKFNGKRSMTLGELASGQIGGVCHELGHAFCLNHTHSNHSQNQKFGTALMGYGNWTFKQELRKEGKGTYLSFVTATKLIGHPCFSAIKNSHSKLQLTDISFNSMSGIFEIHGGLQASPDIYAVIAYCDNLNKRSDYDATGWVGTVDKSGNFQISINELEANQSYTVNLQLLHINGSESSEKINIKTNKSSSPSVEEATREKIILKSIIRAKMKANQTKVDILTKTLTSINKEKSINFLANTIKLMDTKPAKQANEISDSIKKIYLSQTMWLKAHTGYSEPRNNRVHEDNYQKPWPFLISKDKIHRFGLYAHANSEYTYKLDGKWKTLSGELSLRKDLKGSAIFIISGDGKELYNSGIIKDSRERKYKINLDGVHTIKLIVNDAGNGKNSDWGQWLSPLLSR